MGIASNLYKTAVRLIDKYGSNVDLELPTTSRYDTVKGENVGMVTRIKGKAFIESVASSDIVDGIVNIDDVKILMVANNLNKGDKVIHKLKTYKVIAIIDRIEAQDLPIVFTVIGRSK